MKPSAFRIERLLANVEAEVERRGLRARRYVFHPDEVAEAEAQGLPYVLVPRVLSTREWLERYGKQPPADPGTAQPATTSDRTARPAFADAGAPAQRAPGADDDGRSD
jgi:hypothetical protein